MKHHIRWTPQKITARLRLITPLQHRKQHAIAPFEYAKLENAETDAILGTAGDALDWTTIPFNSYWGEWSTNFMMRTTFTIPDDWEDDAPIVLYLPFGDAGDFVHPEALAYIDGQSYASVDRHHHEILLPDSMRDGQVHTLELHGWTGLGGSLEAAAFPPKTQLFMSECYVVQIHQPTRDFVAKVRIVLELARLLPEENPVQGRLMNALDDAFIALDTRDPIGEDMFYDSLPSALATLQVGIDKAGEPLDVDIVGVGHAHIDVAWMWQLSQTRRKAGRTFSNVLRIMEQFPEYHFSQSQAQLYRYIEESYPDIFEQIKARVAEGRWEVMGGTWVEPDCNATGAESLARQFLLGRNYYRKHFGDVDTPVLWLPDTFGYSWALPQLIKQAGMDYFITQKVSWNQYNQMPHQLMRWQGIDGTQVLAHFLTTPAGYELLPFASTYNGNVSAKEIVGTWENFTQKETHNELMTAYGYGDGGGGPTREMLENIDTFANLAGAPRVRFGTVREYMERIQAEIINDLPIWNGEFYLELHRGTLTSQAKTKWNNRKSEFLLHDAEFLATLASLLTDFDYPHDDFTRAWELVCLNQFHDILPGSSITEVYQDADRDYALVRQLAETARDEALSVIASTLSSEYTLMAINPTSFNGHRIGLLPTTIQGVAYDGQALLTQVTDEGTLIDLPQIPAYSVMGLSAGEASSQTTTLTISETETGIILENHLIRLIFTANGDLISIYDKEVQREVLAEGAIGNQFLMMEDRPLAWDAWDIDIFIDDRVEALDDIVSMHIVETGSIRAGLTIVRQYRASTITQTIYLYHHSKRVDFVTHVDWHEQHTLLKVAFPVDILSPTATYDIQWGNVERNTHRNTSWDWGRFETAAQKWADLSEGNYGVALLNDCKYGYDIHQNVMRLSLLKGATMPDPVADQGEHRMTYSLLPHTGDWRNGIPEEAYDLNDPLILCDIKGTTGTHSAHQLVSSNQKHVIIETVKQADNGEGIIVRLYEGERNRGTVKLQCGFDVQTAYLCNLLEENESELSVQDNAVTLTVRPYMIATVRFVPA